MDETQKILFMLVLAVFAIGLAVTIMLWMWLL